MRLAFLGTPDFAVPTLTELVGQGHEIVAVYSQPPRPKGRGLDTEPSPVAKAAASFGIPVRTPLTLKDAEAQAEFAALELDAAIVVAYGLLLPKPILDAPKLGCFNLHGSLLPRWRGAAPIARAIEAGDRESGITIMQMDAGLDTGPIVTAEMLPIGPRETAGALHDRLAALGARLVVDALAGLARDGALTSRSQPADGVTYAAKIERADRDVDWRASAQAIDRKVRALAPAPGALAGWDGVQTRIVAAEPVGEAAPGKTPGEVVAVSPAGIAVCCGNGTVLRLTSVQPASGRTMPAAAFAAGRGVAPGGRFTSAPGAGSAR